MNLTADMIPHGDAGDMDHNGRHAYCGGQMDPVGECDPDGVGERP